MGKYCTVVMLHKAETQPAGAVLVDLLPVAVTALSVQVDGVGMLASQTLLHPASTWWLQLRLRSVACPALTYDSEASIYLHYSTNKDVVSGQ